MGPKPRRKASLGRWQAFNMKQKRLLILFLIFSSKITLSQSLFEKNVLDSLVNLVEVNNLSYDTSAIIVRAFLTDHFDDLKQPITIDTNFSVCAGVIKGNTILKFFVLKYDIVHVDRDKKELKRFTVICNEIKSDIVKYFSNYSDNQIRQDFYIDNLYLRDESENYIKLTGLKLLIK